MIDILFKDGIDVDLNEKIVKMVFLGNTNSGKGEHSFWAVDKLSIDKIDFRDFLSHLGDFSSSKTIEKFSKRYSQRFSTSFPTIELDFDEYLVVNDDLTEDGKFEFTDGIGLIREKTADEISLKLGLQHNPNIYQFRFGGFKGVLVGMPDSIFENNLEKNGHRDDPNIKVIFRNSQKKFEYPKRTETLDIVNAPGEILPSSNLNVEFIMVLDGLVKSRDVRDTIIKYYQE